MDVRIAQKREEIQACFPEGQAYNGPSGTTVENFINAANIETNGRVVAALVDDQLRELSVPLHRDVKLVPITMADSDGVRIYRRSLSFLLIVAAAELFPGDTISVHHSMPFGGYYCERNGGRPVSAEEINHLHNRMRELVEADLPITRVKIPLDEALELFRESGDFEKVDLFTKRRKDNLTLYELNEVRDYFHGFMVPRTSYLDLFDLHNYGDGFIVQFPRRHQPDRLQPFEDEPRLATVFRAYNDWLSIIGVPSVASLNRAIEEEKIQEVILVAETLHNRQLGAIASDIAGRWPGVRAVFISGPTSAGKTTFSKRLAIQLVALGIKPLAINMDNYFVNREDTPIDKEGDYDFESVEALDVALFRDHVSRLLAGETIEQPHFNFRTGVREAGRSLHIEPEHLLLIEGIHGLNPQLTEGVSPEVIFRIFVSAFTQLNLDKHNRIPTTDTRMLRRIVRDATKRGYSAVDTIRRWPSVRRGEKNYIFPYQNNADVFFNSALVYELSVLKPLAQPLLLQVEPRTPERIEANRLLAFLQWFQPIVRDGIPSDSILREFVGGSILENFQMWRQ